MRMATQAFMTAKTPSITVTQLSFAGWWGGWSLYQLTLVKRQALPGEVLHSLCLSNIIITLSHRTTEATKPYSRARGSVRLHLSGALSQMLTSAF